jgi:hypothetical protein
MLGHPLLADWPQFVQAPLPLPTQGANEEDEEGADGHSAYGQWEPV